MELYMDIADLHYDEREEHLRWDHFNKAKERSPKSCLQKQRRKKQKQKIKKQKNPRVQQMKVPDLFV